MRVLIRRTGAFGDVVCTTPVPRRIKKENPDAVIHFLTQYPGVYEGSPDVERCNPLDTNPEDYGRLIDLDLAFERRGRHLHMTDCYFMEAFGDVGHPCDKQPSMVPVKDQLRFWPFTNKIVIHPARSWPHRTLSQEWWQSLVDILIKRGHVPVVTGTGQDWPLTRVIDTRGAFGPRDQVALLNFASVLIASESGVLGGPLHCTDTPAVALLTMGTFEVCAPYRKGRLGTDFYPIYARVDCHGCTTRHGVNVTTPQQHPCLRQDEQFKCVKTFDPEEVVDLALAVRK
jgi:ADP-heptose:LPS heptosyltransferase